MELNQTSQQCGAQCIRILLDELVDPLHALEALYSHEQDAWTIHDLATAIRGKGYHIKNVLALNDAKVFPCIIRISQPDSHYLIVRRRFMSLYLIDNPSSRESEWIRKEHLQKFVPEQIITYERVVQNNRNTYLLIGLSLIDLVFVYLFVLNKIDWIVPIIYFVTRIVFEIWTKTHRTEQFLTFFKRNFSRQSEPINSLLFNDLFHVKIARLYEYEKSIGRATYSIGSLLAIYLLDLDVFLVTLGAFIVLLLCTVISSLIVPKQELYKHFEQSLDGNDSAANYYWQHYVRSSYFASLLKQMIGYLPNIVFILLILLVESGQLTNWYDIIYYPRIPFYGILFWTWQNLSFLSNSIIHPGRFHRI